MIAAVFVALLAGHYAGDYIAQTNWQVIHKPERSWRGATAMFGHLATYFMCQFLALTGLQLAGGIRAGDWVAGFVALGFSVATHGFIDRRWPIIRLMEHTGSAPYSKTPEGPMLVDQAVHIVCLYLAALMYAWVASR